MGRLHLGLSVGACVMSACASLEPQRVPSSLSCQQPFSDFLVHAEWHRRVPPTLEQRVNNLTSDNWNTADNPLVAGLKRSEWESDLIWEKYRTALVGAQIKDDEFFSHLFLIF